MELIDWPLDEPPATTDGQIAYLELQLISAFFDMEDDTQEAKQLKASEDRRRELKKFIHTDKMLCKKYKQDWSGRKRWRFGTRQLCLKWSQRKERQWVRQQLYKENYDTIKTKGSTTPFYDPWDWD